jgi:hypothetical protein
MISNDGDRMDTAMKNKNEPIVRLGRRAFLQHGTLLLTAATWDSAPLWGDEQKLLRVGLVTDLHHADKPPAGSRHYRESVKKLIEAGEHFQQAKTDFIVELGDLIDAADSVDTEQKYLATINREFSTISKDRHYVLGNGNISIKGFRKQKTHEWTAKR